MVTHRLGVPPDGGGLPGGVRPRGVRLVQRRPGLRVEADHERGDAEGPGAPALRVLLLDAGNPPRDVVHLRAGKQHRCNTVFCQWEVH